MTHLVATALVTLATSCSVLSSQPDLTRYYVLTSVAAPDAEAFAFERSVGVGPVTVPDHLEDQLVTRLANEEVAISETDRWSQPLHDAVSGALRQNLIQLLGTQRIFLYPWQPSSKPDLAVTLEIMQFERTAKGTAELKARWSIQQGSNRTPVSIQETSLSRPIQGADTRAAVAALSSALGTLSEQIARDVRRVPLGDLSVAP